MPAADVPVEGIDDEWDEEVTLLVTVRVKAKPNPEYFEGWMERTPQDLAQTGVWTGFRDPEHTDGYADLIGELDVVDVSLL